MTDDRAASGGGLSRRRLIRLSGTAAAALTAAACSARPSGSTAAGTSSSIATTPDIKADTIYRGGTIVTMVDDRRQAQALAVAGGKILAVGSEQDVLDTRGPGTQVVDLAGRTLMPSFIDPHGHFMSALQVLKWANVQGEPAGPITAVADIVPVLKKSVISSAVIMFIIGNAGAFAWLIDRAGVPEQIGLWLRQVLQSPEMFLLGVNAALFVIGMFIETSASIIVLAPILVPVAIHFGVDPVHFGMIMVVNLALGMITPPFGVNLFAACTVARISLDQIVVRLLPFVAVVLGCLMVITYFPPLSLFLRDLVYR